MEQKVEDSPFPEAKDAETPFIAFPPSFGSLQPEEKLSPRPLLQFPFTETSEDVMAKDLSTEHSSAAPNPINLHEHEPKPTNHSNSSADLSPSAPAHRLQQ